MDVPSVAVDLALTVGQLVRSGLQNLGDDERSLPGGHELVDSRLEGGVNRAKLKFTNINTTTSRVSVRNINESEREGEKQIPSE